MIEISLKNLEKPLIDSDSSAPKIFDPTLEDIVIFLKKPFLNRKIKFTLWKNRLYIRTPRSRKPLVQFYKKKQLFSQNKPPLTEK